MKVNTEIISIIASGAVRENTYFLPQIQLDRATYQAVNKCLVNLGGKWNRKAKGHVFDYDPEDAIENLITTGETEDTKKKFQFFPTPKDIAEQMCDMAQLTTSSVVLEPSCGRGDLADVIYARGVKNLLGIELNHDMDIYLKDKPYPVMTGTDFLQFSKEVQNEKINPTWDRIIMNPPFAKQQDITHICAAWSTLKSGILVSVVSPSPFFRTNKASVDFRNFLDLNNAEVVDIPDGAFKESGTMIRTKLIKLVKCGIA